MKRAFKNRGYLFLSCGLSLTVLLLASLSAHAEIIHVQDIGTASLAANGQSSFSIEVTSEVAVGDVIVLEVAYSGSHNEVSPPLPTDSGGNTYAVRGGAFEVFDDTLSTLDYRAAVTTPLEPGDLITINTGLPPNTYNVVAAAQEFSGVSTADDVSTIGEARQGGVTTTFQTGELVTTNADDLIYGYAAVQSTDVTGIAQTTSPMLTPESSIQTLGVTLMPLYTIVSQTGSYSLGGSFLTNSLPAYAVLIYSLKAAVTTAPAANVSVTKSHSGNFSQGENGAQYTFVVSNSGTAATNGELAVTDALPVGLTYASSSSPDWSCASTDVQNVTCVSSTSIEPGQSSAFQIAVNVADDADAQVTNQASVSCSAPCGTNGNPALDPTTITAPVIAPSITSVPTLRWSGLALLALLLAITAAQAVVRLSRR